jgi:dynein light chain LC8-type
MSEENQSIVFGITSKAFEQDSVEKDIAGTIKKELDKELGHTWHVIVGKNFGSYVTHELGSFLYFYVGPYAVLVFKTA